MIHARSQHARTQLLVNHTAAFREFVLQATTDPLDLQSYENCRFVLQQGQRWQRIDDFLAHALEKLDERVAAAPYAMTPGPLIDPS